MAGKAPLLGACAAMAFAVLAGCFDGGQCYSMPTVASVDARAPTTAGSEETELTIEIVGATADGTRPLPGARVAAAWAIPVGSGVAGGDAAALRALRDGHRVGSSERYVLVFARLHTDDAGEAHLRVPSSAVVQVAAVADGHTVERHDDRLGYDSSLPDSVRLLLYPDRLAFEANGTLPMAVATPTQETRGPTTEFRWMPGAGHADLQARMTHLTLGLDWENTVTSNADLGIGAAGSQSGYDVSVNGAKEAGQLGPHNEAGTREADLGWDTWAGIYAWPVVATGLLIDPMPYHLTVEGQFAGTGDLPDVCLPSDYVVHGPMDVAEYEAVPAGDRDAGGGAFLLAFAGLAFAAFIVARRRP